MFYAKPTKFAILGALLHPKTLAVALAFSGVATPAFALDYVVNELIGGNIAFGINNSSQAVGLSDQGGVGYATIWNGASPTYLETLTGGSYASARGINNFGEVVGYSENASSQPNNNVYATTWSGTTPTMLGPLPGANWSVGLGINNTGQTVGYSNDNNGVGNKDFATSWSGTTPTLLQTLSGGDNSVANGINNSGEIVGFSNNSVGGNWITTIWNGTTPTALEMPIGSDATYGNGINNFGEVAGVSEFSTYYQATIWIGTTPTLLPLLPGALGSVATAINDFGQVAGTTFYGGGFDVATIWNGTTPTALPGGFGYAYGMNDLGAVVGFADTGAVVWTPASEVPEPSTWAMMLLGFAGVGYAGYPTARIRLTLISRP